MNNSFYKSLAHDLVQLQLAITKEELPCPVTARLKMEAMHSIRMLFELCAISASAQATLEEEGRHE